MSTTIYVKRLIQENRLPLNTELTMVTNGISLNPKMVKFLVDNQISIGISLDGPEEINDAYRVSKDGKGSFQQTVKAYHTLRKAGAKIGISITLTPLVVEHFPRVLDFFEHELGIQQGLAFNILHYNPNIPVDESYYERAADCILEAFPRFRAARKWEDRMMRKAEAFAHQKIVFADCAAIGHQLVISPDGQIGICQDFIKPRKYFTSSVFNVDFDPYEDENFQEWLRRSPLNMSQCLDCEAIAICGGGCPASAQAYYGSMWEVDRRVCPFSKKALEWLIWNTYDQME
jgi:uncharacterized protein